MYTTDVESTELAVLSDKTKSKYTRFKDVQWFDNILKKDIIVAGVGGIGSWVSLLLSRLGCSLYLYDFDHIDSLNLAGQIFRKKDIGELKTQVMRKLIKEFSDNDLVVCMNKYTKNSPSCEIVFSCFDNMASRKVLFNRWVQNIKDYKNPILIDGRLLIESFQIFCVTKDKIKGYKKYLFDDSEVEDIECTMKQTSHCAAMIASHMVGFLTNHLSEGRQVPFYYEYILPVNFVNLNP